jgi:putative aldouronate transport system permease protein
MKYNKTLTDKIFDIFNIIFMLIVLVLTLYPFWYSFIASFNNGKDFVLGGVYLWPRKFTLLNYITVFRDADIAHAYLITVLRTVIGTATSVLFTALFSYGFSRKSLVGKNIYVVICMIPMYIGGGLIPYYMLIKQMHLYNNFLVYIIPMLFSFYNVLIIQSFFREIPEAIIESAYMDGAGEYRIFWSFIMPLSKPVLATIVLFNGVGHWNSFFDSMMFTSKPNLQTIQLLLMKIIRLREGASLMAQVSLSKTDLNQTAPVTIQMATMMVATIPIIILYPFLQKYFVTGMTIGSVKG